MKKWLNGITSTVLFVILIIMFLSTNAAAVPFSFGSAGPSNLQGTLDDATVGGSSSIDVTQDALSDINDSYWSVTAAGISVSTIMTEMAGYADTNTFGIFDYKDPSKKVELYDGAASTSDTVTIGIKDDGGVFLNSGYTGIDFAGNRFGFYIDATIGNENSNAIFYSDTSLNKDNIDHMAAYQGTNTDEVKIGDWSAGTWTPNEYVLALEDLWNQGDGDFADMVVMVESAQPAPVPEPTTMMLFGIGLVGMTGFARYRRSRNKIIEEI